MTESSGMVQPGEVFAGKFRVERVLGEGGMGVVFAAHHIQLDERVAIKFLLPSAMKNPDLVARFDREARAAVKIKSEHVARVIDVGRLDSGAPYIVMEHLDGCDLSAWTKKHGVLSFEQAADFVLQACEAIAEAHAIGIVHRDLKPSNLFCIRRADGRLAIKVLDFGISKYGGTFGPDVTSTQAMLGSPLYMSPEQLRSSKNVDTRTDVWSLGAVLFELVTGHVPFGAESLPELVARIMTDPAPSVRDFRPDAPESVVVTVQRCLEKDRDRRYPNVGELAVDLMAIAPRHARASVERITGVLKNAGLSTVTLPTESPLAATEPAAPLGSIAPTARGSSPSVGGAVVGTQSAWGNTSNKTSARPRGRRIAALVGLGGAVLATLIVAAVMKLPRFRAPAPATAPTSSEVAEAKPPVPRDAPANTTSPPVVEIAASAPTSAPQTSASPRAGRQPAVAPVRAGAKPPAAAASATAPVEPKPTATPTPAPTAPANNCTPPYEFDASGKKLWKRECVK